MSIDYVVALAAPPPDVAVIAPRLARYGKPRGSWRDRVTFGNLTLQQTDDTDTLRMAHKHVRRGARLVATVQLWGSHSGIEDAASVLAELCGGGVLLTDEGVVIDTYAPARGARSKPIALAPIDVTIPDAVRAAFISGQPRYALASRRKTHYELGAFFAEAGVDRHSELELTEAPLENFTDELHAHGVPKAVTLYRVHYKHWYTKTAREDHWEAMLAATCGFARDSGGVLYTIGPPQTKLPPAVDLRHDFEPATRPRAARRAAKPA